MTTHERAAALHAVLPVNAKLSLERGPSREIYNTMGQVVAVSYANADVTGIFSVGCEEINFSDHAMSDAQFAALLAYYTGMADFNEGTLGKRHPSDPPSPQPPVRRKRALNI